MFTRSDEEDLDMGGPTNERGAKLERERGTASRDFQITWQRKLSAAVLFRHCLYFDVWPNDDR